MKRIKKMNRSALILPVVLLVLVVVMLAASHSGWRVFFPKVKVSEITATSNLKEKTTVGGEILLTYDYPADNKDGKFYLAAGGNGNGDFLYIYVPKEYDKKFAQFKKVL